MGQDEPANLNDEPRFPQQPDVSVLIVAFKSQDFILDCIESIYRHTARTAFEVLVIDNSDDGTAELLAERAPEVRVVPNKENLGFGRGNNRLAEAARGKRLLLLNPDTWLTDDAIDRLDNFAQLRPEAGAWGGLTITPDGELDAGNRLVFPTLRRLMRWTLGDGAALEEGGLPGRDRTPGKTPGPVDVLPGGFMMVRRDVWDALGGFDEEFFLYSEEIDFFLRLKRAGFAAWATPHAVVVHDAGSGDRGSPQRLLYRTKGQMHYVRKHWSGPRARAALALLWIGFTWRWLAGLTLGVWSPRDRAQDWRRKRRAYGGLAFRPWRWWRGYAS